MPGLKTIIIELRGKKTECEIMREDKDGTKIIKDPLTKKCGIVDSNGKLVREPKYTNCIGRLSDGFMLCYIEKYKNVPAPVDYDIDCYRSYDVYQYHSLYLIDKAGNEMPLDLFFEENCKITYGGPSCYYDGKISFKCEYETKGYLDTHYRSASISYEVYPQDGKGYVDVEISRWIKGETSKTTAVRLYFTGTRDEISPAAISKVRKPNN